MAHGEKTFSPRPSGTPFPSDACAFPLHFQALKACPRSFGMGQGRADTGASREQRWALAGPLFPAGEAEPVAPTSWYRVLSEHRSQRKNALVWFGSAPSWAEAGHPWFTPNLGLWDTSSQTWGALCSPEQMPGLKHRVILGFQEPAMFQKHFNDFI